MAAEYLDTLPESVPDDRWLVHNHVRPAHPLGMNGFRAWLDELGPERREPCDCRWASELGRHFRVAHDGA
jgi:hypothetical protein